MASGTLSGVRKYFHSLIGTRNADPLADGQLLARYVAQHDEAAFTALVERYGPLVLGVCRRVLRDAHDAEDAFQATFLVLARRASTLDGRGPLGNWLYGVAYRTALKAKANAARRRAHERQGLDMAGVLSSSEKDWTELWPVFDEELNQLPEKYRAPLVLCFLEGKSHLEAARALGWPSGSMSRRMQRARELLRERLAKRGVGVSAALLLALLTDKAAATTVPAALAATTAKAAVAFGTGTTAAVAVTSAEVVALAESVLKMLATYSFKTAATVVLVIALLIVITGGGTVVAQQLISFFPLGGTGDCHPLQGLYSPPSGGR
jgi:RNA polymerase sigma-70 factor (ECF subfamily)